MTVFVAGFTDFIRLEEQHLGHTFIGVDLGRQIGGVGEFQGDLPFPLRLQRSDVNDDSATGVGALAQTNGKNTPWNTEVFNGTRQGEAVGRDHAHIANKVDKTVFVEVLRVDGGTVNVGKDLEFVAAAYVVAVTRGAVGYDPALFIFPNLSRLEGFDHAVLLGHPADPLVGFDAHGEFSFPAGGKIGA